MAVTADMLPTTDQVHALIPMRPAFTLTSRPNVTEVQDIIELAAETLGAETTTWPEALTGKVRYLIALNAASLVESSFWPEQGIGDESPAQILYSRYVDELAGLRTLLGSSAAGSAGSSSVYSMPLASSPVVYDYPPSYWVV